MSSNLAFTNQGSTSGVLPASTKPVNISQGMPGLTFNSPGQPTAQTAQPKAGTNPGVIAPTASSALKKTTTTGVDGSTTTHEYHAPLPADDPSNKFNTTTGKPNPNYKDPNSPTPAAQSTPAPQPLTSTNPATQAENLAQAGQPTAWENQVKNGSAVNDANKALTDFRLKEAETFGNTESQPIPLVFQQGREQVLQRQAAQQEGALQTGVSNALSNQGQQFGAAATQAGRASSAAGTVFNAGLMTPTSPGQASYSPISGYQGGSSQFGNPNDPATGVNLQSYKDYYDKYNQGLGGINTATANEPGILSTLTKFGLNNQPLSAITNLKELLSGQASQPGQQQLSMDVANYIKALGIDPATLSSSIANQQSGTLVQLLNNLKQIATTNNNALKTTADGLKTKDSNTSSGSTGGSLFGSFFG